MFYRAKLTLNFALATIYRLASLAVDCVTFPPYNKAGIVSCAHNITHTSVCTGRAGCFVRLDTTETG